jgi:ketosteroid isomerase-like protein
MNTSRLVIAFLVAGVLAYPLRAHAADSPAPGRIPTVTRLVKLFLELEGALAAGVRSGNATAVDGMVADDFELRVASMPGNPTPRAEWLRLALDKPGPSFRIEQMAVHDFGEVAIVSFLEAAMAGEKRDATRDIATVDVWKRSGETWKLAVRYAGPAGSHGFAIPGASMQPPIEKRY